MSQSEKKRMKRKSRTEKAHDIKSATTSKHRDSHDAKKSRVSHVRKELLDADPLKKEEIIRVNLREEREARQLSREDIQIRTGIPIHFIEALETGIIPEQLKGRQLLSHKHSYLTFLGFPKNAKLRSKVTQKKFRKSRSQTQTIVTSTGDITAPSPRKSILMGFALAGAMIFTMRILSLVTDDDALELSGALDDAIVHYRQSNITDATPQNPQENPTVVEDVKITEETTNSRSMTMASLGSSSSFLEIPSAHANQIEKDKSLVVYGIEKTKIYFRCDDELLYEGYLEPKTELNCDFGKEASVDIADISRTKISYNGNHIQPMGPQASKRKLVFRN